ncbi:ring finger and CCCH-type domains 2 [Octopus vulgaris]|uniref:RING-type E3 ubiquitin transferase n=1 Tax=Octopus vulgaris TaxID=6645 RepID=A0AA36BRL8_OCTVU|nr:ring finger and CCCH-type domains 2 [Octopus vulgaris]
MPIQAPQWTDFLSCPVCCNLFNEQYYRPISLGCGHTVCKSCLSKLHSKKCLFDQSIISRTIEELPVNYALLQLVGTAIPEKETITISDRSEHCRSYESANRCIEQLAVYLKPFSAGAGNTNAILSRPMQRKLVALVNCQLIEEEGRARAMRAARSLSERTVTELILQHQNPQQLSANLWAAVRARGCQFLGPAMQEEVLKLILLALEDGSALSRKVLVLFVVQRLEPQYPQASKTAIGHVVQLLYRASCFKVTKRDEESSLMQLKEEFRTYETLRREHDAQIVQIATEAGLRISPDQWSSLLYGDTAHKSHMQSIIDKLQTPQSFGQSVNELVIALQRTGDPGNLSRLRPHFELLANIDPSPDAPIPTWENLEAVMKAVQTVVEGLVDFIQHYSHKKHEPANLHNTKYKTNMCRDLTQKGSCPRAANCTFAHSQDEMEKYRARNKKFGGKTGTSSVAGLTPKEKAELDQVTKSTRERMIAKSARQDTFNPMGIKHISVKLNSSSDSVNTEGSPPGSLSTICSPNCNTTNPTMTATTTSITTATPITSCKPNMTQVSAGLTSNTSTVSSVSYQLGSANSYNNTHIKHESSSPVPVTHSHTISNSTPCIVPYEIPPPSHILDGNYYKPAPYCIPPCHQRMPVPHPQYLFNYRVDQGIPHMQYRASTISMLDIHSMPVASYTDPWKKPVNHFDQKSKETHVQQRIVPTSGPFPDHSGWEQPVPSNTISQSKSLEDLLDRRLEILNIVQKKEMSPNEIPTTGAPCTPVTNAPAIYQGNHRMNVSMEVNDVGVEPKMITTSSLTKSKSYVSTATTPSLSYRTSCGSLNKCTTAESSYVSWSCGDSPNAAIYSPHHNLSNCSPQNSVEIDANRPNKNSSKDHSSVFNIFSDIDSPKKDIYEDSREDFARHSHGENDDFIPFDPPIVSKFGPISRTKVKDKTTCPVQVTAEGNTPQVIPVTASTPYEHNYMVSSSLAPSSYKNIVITNSNQSQLRPDAKPFVSSSLPETIETTDENTTNSGEPYTLWNYQETLQEKSNSKIKKELSQLAQQSQIASTDGEKLDLELRTINLQITLKMKSLHMALEAQLKESNMLNKKRKQEQEDRQYAEDLVIEELVQKVKDTNSDDYITDPEPADEIAES